MRVGTFLLGGIAGAAAVIYLNRKTKSALLQAFTSSNDSVGNTVGKAKNTSTGKTGFESSAKNSKENSTFPLLEKMMKEDQESHHTVN
jgi:uncharacterized membrane protein